VKAKETKLPPAPEIVTERPEGMEFAEYKLRRRISNLLVKRRLRDGFPSDINRTPNPLNN